MTTTSIFIRSGFGVAYDSLLSATLALGIIYPSFKKTAATLRFAPVVACLLNVWITLIPMLQHYIRDAAIAGAAPPNAATLITPAAHTASLIVAISTAVYTIVMKEAFCNNSFVVLNLGRVLRLVLDPDVLSPHFTIESAVIHLFLAWCALDISIKSEICHHLKRAFAIDGFALLRLYHKRELTLEDLKGDEYEYSIQKARIASRLDYSKRFFIARLIISTERKQLLIHVTGNVLSTLAMHCRRLLFVDILVLLQTSNISQDYTQVVGKLVVWQLLGVSKTLRNYSDIVKKQLQSTIENLIVQTVLRIHSTKRGKSCEYWELLMRVRAIAERSTELVSTLGGLFAEIFNIWLIASRVGWMFIIPIAIAAVHHTLSHVVNNKTDRIYRENRRASKPNFRENLWTFYDEIRSIKAFVWEEAFRTMISQYEVPSYIPPVFWRLVQHGVHVIGSATSQIAAAITISSYIGSTKSPAYTDIALLMESVNSLTQFSSQMALVVEGLAEIREKSEFINQLLKPTIAEYVNVDRSSGDSKDAIELDRCAFSWGADKFGIAPTTLRVNAGELVMIVGRVGGGKSSFVNALCGEMPVVSGTGKVNGRIGYVEQKPTILYETLRENVLMGQDFDEKFYWQVLEACDLVEDIQEMPQSDLTRVGARGMKLSGGQKTRLALARALYLRADVYIFDDVLSAVDARVERHIVNNVLSKNGIIGAKTRVLVTHASHLLPLANMIITFVDGCAHVTKQAPRDSIFKSTLSNDETSGTEADPSEPNTPASTDKKKPRNSDDYDFNNSPTKWSHMLKFLRYSKYWRVATVLSIYFVNAYLLHCVSKARLRLMTDTNPDTAIHSLQRYLHVNALIAIFTYQIGVIGSWTRKYLWARPLMETLRVETVNVLLRTSLTQIEKLPRLSLIPCFVSCRYRSSFNLPDAICHSLISNCLSIASTIVQIYMFSPALLLLLIPILAILAAKKISYGNLCEKIGSLAHEYSQASVDTATVLHYQRILLRVLEVSDKFISKLIRLYADYNCAQFKLQLAWMSRSLIETLHLELIQSAVLIYNIWRQIYKREPISSGQIDATTSLLVMLVEGLDRLLSVDGGFNLNRKNFSRMLGYLENLKQEAPMVLQHARPPKNWPNTGTVEFKNYSMRYQSELELTLREISFSVCANEKVGIVGRTGAGKSSLSQALMRLVEPASGKIFIDDVDISSIGLYDLRSRISIIPQDPTLFVGTIRDNLDPLGQYSDEEIWKAVRLAQVAELLETPSGKYVKPDLTKSYADSELDEGPWIEGVGLQKWVSHGGNNFSVGQRQLISLCRALLWRRKILLLDEATANVDSKTDQIMQRIIRKEFTDCTVLTIAHRLDTILDSDRILVVHNGEIVEFDTPANLLKHNGHFSMLVESMNQAHSK